MYKQCELIELIKEGQVFRRYTNCKVDILFEHGIIIYVGKNQIYVQAHNILGWELMKGNHVIANLEVYCSNTF